MFYVLSLHSIFKNSINRIIIFKDNYLQVKNIKTKEVIFYTVPTCNESLKFINLTVLAGAKISARHWHY